MRTQTLLLRPDIRYSRHNARVLAGALGALLGALLLMQSPASRLQAQTFERGPTRSPHGPLSIPCSSCHTEKSWKTLRAVLEFNHDTQTRYPLRGMHESVKCSLCHARLVFNQTSTRCADCHADLHRRQFGASCDQCHTVKGWTVAVQNIKDHLNRFPLLGAHAMVECDACHTGAASGQFTGLSTACSSCHVRDFNRTTEPNHAAAGFGTACDTCHGMDTFLAAKFDHAAFAHFPLTGAHATVPCASCHVGNRYAGTPATCVGCHAQDFASAKNPDHAQGGFSTDCALCHTTVTWDGARFDHSASSFPLTGAHAAVPCTQCHGNNQYAGLSTACVSCHLKDYQGTANPNHAAGGFSQDCQSCHNTTSWAGATFDHGKTAFPLTGAHLTVACATCHLNNVYAGLSTACVSCHLKDYQGTTNPNHAAGGLSQDCQVCHSTTNWAGATFDHAKTAFPLTGAHVNVACATCHVNNVYATLSTACVSCHLKDYQGATNPNHAASGFPQDCLVCHNTTSWAGATFDHAKTAFPLTGAHVTVACATCHVNNVYARLSTACVSCHLKDYQGTTNPSHGPAGFPQTCDTCHTTTNWSGATFNHTTQTKFPLTGAHVNVACNACHTNNVFAGLPMACVSCHLKDYQGASNPNHVAAGFPQTCDTCHNTANWSGATFNHTTQTKFPLTGAHGNVACNACHLNNVFAGLPTACVSCHLKDYQGTNNPNHSAAGFPQTCDTCHSTTDWSGATFNHTTQTKFPLTGAHINVACSTCHVNNVYAGLATACVSCHLKDYQGTTNPNHAAAGFPQDCSVCHSTTDWSGAVFDHSKTPFPLTGAHVSVACATCHVNNVFAGLSTACVSCHLKDYNAATSPNHASLGFPQDCSLCHTTTNFTSSTFNHSTTTFPLTGAHVNVACASCHINGNYTTTPTDCYSCHQADYTGTTNPNHVAAGFPTTCATCHTTTAWTGATFNHTWFPMNHGNAKVCSDCHTNSADYSVFQCTGCHTQAQTDPEHRGVKGYIWNSINCYQCHPSGRGG